jgi:hypothetical protein
VAINVINPYLIDWVVQFWWLGLEDMNFSLHLLFPQHNLWNTKLVRTANTAAWTGLEQGALFGEALVTERNGENVRNEFTSPSPWTPPQQTSYFNFLNKRAQGKQTANFLLQLLEQTVPVKLTRVEGNMVWKQNW